MAASLTARVNRIKPSPTLSVNAKANELRAHGHDIISLSVGEPDFGTPDHINQAAIEAINSGQNKYTPVDGTAALKQAVIDKFKRENGLAYESNQILVSCGAKHSLYNIFNALIESGDEVIIPAPYWVSYPDITLLCGGKPVIIETSVEQRFKITPEALAAAITPKTKLFLLNSPSNPTGVAYTSEELKAIAQVLLDNPHVTTCSDDIYEHVLWNGTFSNIVNACPELKDRTIVVNGVSKAFAMTGWRIGYLAGPAELVAGMKKVQSQSTSNPCSIAQAAAVAALNGGLDCVTPMVEAFKLRHPLIIEGLNSIPGVHAIEADGTFYAFPNVQELIDGFGGIDDDIALAEHLLEEAGVAVVPGTAFGAPGCLRLSFAVDEATIREALARIKRAVCE